MIRFDRMSEPATLTERRFPWPADYYSAPTPDPLLPRAVAYGCGAGSLVVLIAVFAGGFFLSRGGFVSLMDMGIGMSVGEMRGMYADSIPEPQRESLEAEIERMREAMRSGDLPPGAVQPFLETMRQATSDGTVDPGEAEKLEESARKTREAAPSADPVAAPR
jgi:hypothetical protein